MKDALVNQITQFLLELATGFGYVGRQVQLQVVDYFVSMSFGVKLLELASYFEQVLTVYMYTNYSASVIIHTRLKAHIKEKAVKTGLAMESLRGFNWGYEASFKYRAENEKTKAEGEKMKTKRIELKKIFLNRFGSQLIPWLWLAGGYIYDLWYHIFPGKWILDSDLAAEMVLADKLNKEHSILSTDWFYSTELRVFHSQWFYRLGLLFFPDNWHRARVVAVALMFVLFAALLIWFSKMIGLEKYGIWCAAFMMWPFGSWYLVYGIFGTYYIIYMLFSLSVIGILMKLVSGSLGGCMGNGRGRLLLYVAGVFISFASGLNGIRQLLVFFVPLLAGLVLFVYFDAREKKTTSVREMRIACGKELGMFAAGFLFTVCNVAGYLINLFILSKKYDFRGYGDIEWAWEPINSLYDVWFDFLRLYGFQRVGKLVSFQGIASALGLILGAVVLLSIIRLCMRYRMLERGIKITLLVTISTLLINGLVYCLADIDYKQYHWLPLLPFGAALIVAEIKTEKFEMKHIREVFLVMVMTCVTVCSFSTVKKEQENPLLPVGYGYNQMADWLVEHGLTQGYSSFWSAAVLREMSDGKIETWTIRGGSTVYEWLQEKDHVARPPEKPYFFLFDNRLGGDKGWYTMINDGSGKLIYQDDFFEIWVYE